MATIIDLEVQRLVSEGYQMAKTLLVSTAISSISWLMRSLSASNWIEPPLSNW